MCHSGERYVLIRSSRPVRNDLEEPVTTEPVNEDIIRIALDKVEGSTFERFGNTFFSALVGASFVPVGGMKDGGADARDGTIHEYVARPGTFYQMSIEQNYESKIRRTVQRLREFGRDPRVLTYVTSINIKHSDRVERALTDELDVTISIRDGDYIAAHINDDEATRYAFAQHLQHYTEYLSQVGSSNLISSSKHVRSPAVFVFLANEIERREGNESLVDSVTDALIVWALEGTDPESEIFRTEKEVLARIIEDLPSVQDLVAPRLSRRLDAISKTSKKQFPDGRPVQWHSSKNAYCLPFVTRQSISLENAADEALLLRVIESFEDRLREASPTDMDDELIREAGKVALRALQITFEREGAEFSSFIHKGGTNEYPTILDALREALQEMEITGKQGQAVGDGSFLILRGVLYESRDDERRYLQRLSRTYALLFTLNTEPRLLEFFQDMTAEFRLYVGTDQIIRALSEHYLAEPDQLTRNNLLITKRLGANLILTEPVLTEVVHHLRGADTEFRSRISQIEHRLTYEVIRNVPQIMLRAYLYARINHKLGSRGPRSWQAFIEQFCSHKTLWKKTAFSDLQQYLQTKFGFSYETTAELKGLVDEDEVESLAQQLIPSKRDPELAYNDALLALAVYGRRLKSGENSKLTEFGWGTWWLTEETSILKFTREIVNQHDARYIMRPDFLLNFLTLVPSAREVRHDFSTIFPSMLGVRLAQRMSDSSFNEIMEKFIEGESLDEARRVVEMNKMMNKLKSDFSHQFVADRTNNRTGGIDAAAERTADE